MKRAFIYGATQPHDREKILAQLPRITHYVLAPEQYGRKGGIFSIDWTHGRTAARTRNCTAAMYCQVLVVVKRPKFSHSIITAFRQRGRLIYWWNGSKLQEITASQKALRSIHDGDKPGTWEPDLWEAQRAEKLAAIEEYLDAHPEKARTPDSIPTFGWVEVFNEDEIECSPDDIFKRCRRSQLTAE